MSNQKKKRAPNPLGNMDPVSQYRNMEDNISDINENFNNIINLVKPFVKDGLKWPCEVSKKLSKSVCGLSDNATKGLKDIDKYTDLNKLKDNMGKQYADFQKNPMQSIQTIAQDSLEKTKQMGNKLSKKTGEFIDTTKQNVQNLSNKVNPNIPVATPVYGQKKGNVTDNLFKKKNVGGSYRKNNKKHKKSKRKSGRYFGRNRAQTGGSRQEYNYIINPYTNRKVSIYGRTGRRVLKSYLITLLNK